MSKIGTNKQKIATNFILIAAAALIVRFLLSGLIKGFETDVNCFLSWSETLFKGGISKFYADGGFHDYPPGYMYILWVVGAIRNVFGISGDFASIALIKLPAIICDIIAGYYIYKIAKENRGEFTALICALAYLFNPAILVNSAIWGQVDSVFTVFIILTVYYIYKKRLPLAYLFFCIGFLIKPQIAFILPVLILAIVEQVILKNFSWKNFFYNLGTGLASIGVLLLLMLPFGIGNVISQYTSTVTSYPYTTVNAYNFWAMLGRNWKPQNEAFIGLPAQYWGIIFIVAVFFMVFWIWLKMKGKSKYILMSIVSIIGIFTLSVRMHERYMFPALVLLLIYYAVKPRREALVLYGIFSVLQTINVIDVLFTYSPDNFDWEDPLSRTVGFFMTAGFVLMIYFCFNFIKNKFIPKIVIKSASKVDSSANNNKGKAVNTDGFFTSKPLAKIVKKDLIIIAIVTVLYACIAFFYLGDMKAPQSGWTGQSANEQIEFEFDKPVVIKSIKYYLGNYHNPHFTFEILDSTGSWVKVLEDKEFNSVFKWSEQTFTSPSVTNKIRMTSLSDKASIWELTFIDQNGNYVTPDNADICPQLFDEKELIPARESSLNGTYFDEIYHARTAWEYTQGLYSYENTHPPLGKIFIMFGILLFGMVPFGWRVAGVIFGIIMLPCIYIFAKKMFSKTWIAASAIILFAADFMHFTQTRIATIDVFVTLFIILMYFFMYIYMKRSYYDRSFKRIILPLALSGVAMGLGMASKWTGVYAACGLAILFFYDLHRRYKEYKYALQSPGETTNGISHKRVIKEFPYRTKQIIVLCFIFFIIVPVIIYTLSYIPFVNRGDETLITRMLENAQNMYNYHSKLVSEHAYSSKWYQWPIMTRPMWYYSYHVTDTVSEGISAFGNPLVWWAGIPAVLYLIYSTIRKKDKTAIFLLIGYFAQYLPWFFVSRTTYIYHYFPSVPFVILMLCYCFRDFVEKDKKRKKYVFIYLTLAVILFIMFYPVLSGYPVDKNYVSTWLRWFSSWVLVT